MLAYRLIFCLIGTIAANATAQEQSVQPVAQVKLTSATLAQNQPNPAANNTAIAYELPEKYTSASIRITPSTGTRGGRRRRRASFAGPG